MRYAVISDIHANLEAFEAVRAEIARLGVHRVLSLGDAVGYGASPAECIDGLRHLADVAVAGNHDFGVAGADDIRNFNPHARRAAVWTAGVLGQRDLDYLRGLPLEHVEHTGGTERSGGTERAKRRGDSAFRIVHATPSDPGKWEYLFGTDHAAAEFKAFPEPLCFVGHSHQPGIFEIDKAGKVTRLRDRATSGEGRRHIVNVGSVGQPRDGDPRACLCLYDAAAGTIEILRVAYDVKGAARRIIEAELPQVLANRLSLGE